jgi:N-hydroxyarylamine O-acetyltransferase
MTAGNITLPVHGETSAEWGAARLDLDAYLRRIGYDGPLTTGAETLRGLHRAHMQTIAFENVDVALGRSISLEMDDLQRKLVESGRGGYCFEHNLLFAAALERLGFPITRLLARVRRGSAQIRYRAHAVLLVGTPEQAWLADVGFGDEGLIEPIELSAGATATTGAWTWRVRQEGSDWILQSRHADGWFDLYTFRVERHFQVDFEVSNYYTAHSSRSTFVGKLIAMRETEQVRHVLKDRQLVSRHPDGRTQRTELSGAELTTTLRDTFGVHLSPADARLLHQRF